MRPSAPGLIGNVTPRPRTRRRARGTCLPELAVAIAARRRPRRRPCAVAWRRSSSSVPSAMSRPCAMTPMRSAMRSATSRICVVMMMAPPSAYAFAQHVLDLARGAGVEPGQRLVENDHARVVHQRAGERHLLAHALGKPLAALIGMGGEIEPIEQLACARLCASSGSTPHSPATNSRYSSRRELVVDHRLVGDPRHDPLRRDRIGERIDAGDADRAGVGPRQPGDHAQRRGLAGAVRSEQRIKLAGAHGEVETVDRRAVEAFDEAADFEGAWRQGASIGRVPSS